MKKSADLYLILEGKNWKRFLINKKVALASAKDFLIRR